MRRLESIAHKQVTPHPAVGRTLFKYAVLFMSNNQFTQAEQFFVRALKHLEDTYGPDYPEVADCLMYLARLYRMTNRNAAAKKLEKRLTSI